MVTNILFNAKISKMGDYRIIWIPKSLSEMIKPFEDEKRVLVQNNEHEYQRTMAKGGKFVVDKE